MPHYPEPVVGAFIFNTNGQLLLLKSHKWRDTYVVPGGHIEIGESIENALQREVKEETGLDITSPQFICLHEFITEPGFYKKKHMLFLNYQVTTSSQEITLNNEAQEYLWITPEKALDLPLEKYTQLTIAQHLIK